MLVGRLGSDPEFQEFKNQTAAATGIWKVSLCTTKSKLNQISNEWEQDVTWHNVSSLKQINASKGSMVLVEGEIRNYRDQNEVLRTQIQAQKFNVLYSKPKEEHFE